MGKSSELSVREVASLLCVPVVKVQRWVHNGRIPCRFKGNRYYFVDKEILEWARVHNFQVRNSEQCSENGESVCSDIISSSLSRGIICFDHAGSDIYSVLKGATDKMPESDGFTKEMLLAELVRREEIASTGIGCGVALPHPGRDFDTHFRHSVISLFFLKESVDYNALDCRPVDILFFIFALTPEKHLRILSKISHMLRCKGFTDKLRTLKSEEEVIAYIAEQEISCT